MVQILHSRAIRSLDCGLPLVLDPSVETYTPHNYIPSLLLCSKSNTRSKLLPCLSSQLQSPSSPGPTHFLTSPRHHEQLIWSGPFGVGLSLSFWAPPPPGQPPSLAAWVLIKLHCGSVCPPPLEFYHLLRPHYPLLSLHCHMAQGNWKDQG